MNNSLITNNTSLFLLLCTRLLSLSLKENLDERVEQSDIEKNISIERIHTRAFVFLNEDDEEGDNGGDHTESELNNLKERHKAFPAGDLSCNCPLQEVCVHDDMYSGIPRQPDKVEALFVFDPCPGHE